MQRKKLITDIQEKSSEEDKAISVRPSLLDEYIGQQMIKDRVNIAIKASKKRNAPLDHLLLFGPPGLGKTSLAYVIANEMKQNIRYIAGPSIERAGDIVSILTQLKENEIIFIDEIHRIDKGAEEVLYSAMEDFFVNITIGKENQSKQIKISLPKFTLIAATTRPGMLSHPLRDRFGMHCRMEYYTDEELSQIVNRTGNIMNIKIDNNSAALIAKSSRGTPRIAIRNTSRVRDYALANNKAICKNITQEALYLYGICSNGLNETDMAVLKVLNEKDGAIGLETLSALTGEDIGTIEAVYEPYLIKEGYVEKTPKGRIITKKGKQLFL